MAEKNRRKQNRRVDVIGSDQERPLPFLRISMMTVSGGGRTRELDCKWSIQDSSWGPYGTTARVPQAETSPPHAFNHRVDVVAVKPPTWVFHNCSLNLDRKQSSPMPPVTVSQVDKNSTVSGNTERFGLVTGSTSWCPWQVRSQISTERSCILFQVQWNSNSKRNYLRKIVTYLHFMKKGWPKSSAIVWLLVMPIILITVPTQVTVILPPIQLPATAS